MSKGPDAFRTISEVAEELDLPQHVLRFWETRFAQIRPMKRGGGRRYYRPDDVELLRGIRRLLYGEGYTIKGVQRILKEHGLRHVAAFGHDGVLDAPPNGGDIEDDDDIAVEPATEVPSRRASATPPAASSDQRREPVFDSRTEPVSRVVERTSPRRPGAEPVPNVSNFPAAPPDEPEDMESYLPPLVASAPPMPAPARESLPPVDPPMPSRGEGQRDGRSGALPPTGAERREAHAAARAAAAPARVNFAGMTQEDRESLKAALVELLECKRLLDQAR